MSVPDLYLAVDFGASATKFSFCPGSSESDARFQVKLMPPDVEIINRDKLEQYFTRQTMQLHPREEIEEIWLEAKGQLYVLGQLAQQFDPIAPISEVKYEKAAYKTLAALGYALSACTQSGKLPKKKVYKVSLAVLLPWAEFPDKERYKSFVSSLLSSAKYRDTSLSVKFSNFSVRQEGFGLFYLYQQTAEKKTSQFGYRDSLTILLFGHRNLSVLFFPRGLPPRGASPLLGFHQVLDAVADSLSWLDRQQVSKAWTDAWLREEAHFFEGTYLPNSAENQKQLELTRAVLGDYDHYVLLEMKYPTWQDLPSIQKLARAQDPDLRQQEIRDIHLAFERAIDDYWESFSKWFTAEFPETDESLLLLSGGASWFVLPKLAGSGRLTVHTGLNQAYTDAWKCRQPQDFIRLALHLYLHCYESDNSDEKLKLRDFLQGTCFSRFRLIPRHRLYRRVSDLAQSDPALSYSYARYTSRQRTADVVGLSAYLRERNNDG
jgi:hypothetical protein